MKNDNKINKLTISKNSNNLVSVKSLIEITNKILDENNKRTISENIITIEIEDVSDIIIKQWSLKELIVDGKEIVSGVNENSNGKPYMNLQVDGGVTPVYLSGNRTIVDPTTGEITKPATGACKLYEERLAAKENFRGKDIQLLLMETTEDKTWNGQLIKKGTRYYRFGLIGDRTDKAILLLDMED